jgi:hypothetical protein
MQPSRRALFAALSLAAFAPAAAFAQTTTIATEVATEVSGAKLQGQGKLTYFGLHVYDARRLQARRIRARSDRP